MGAAKKLIDKKVLRALVPINALSAGHIDEISRKAVIEELRAGAYLFKKGDRDGQTLYLLEGQLEFVDAVNNPVDTLAAGTEQARHPIAHKQPRQLGARAKGKATVARIDTSLLDVLLTWDESAGYDVVEIDSQDDGDWMTRMLQSQAFLQLPPANIHQLLMRLESVNASAGDVVVRQGEEGDYFYIVKSGSLAVTRRASPRSKEVLLAELGEGACFGEEALVSGAKRNASVMMVTDGSLMRLSKTDFDELLCTPLVHEVDFEEAQRRVADEGARWLDVRLPGEFENQAIQCSLNVPLSALRDQCATLDKATDYILCCDTGRRSASGAFVLSQLGFTVFTLKNGLMDVPEAALERACGEPPVARPDADIIPFESETRPENSVARAQRERVEAETGESDSDLIDRLAVAEGDRLALQEEVARLEEKVAVLDGELQAATADRDAQLRALQTELDASRRQLEESQQTSTAAEQQRGKRLLELEKELTRLRDDYQQLGQRTSAVAGERDAVNRQLQETREQLAALQARAGDEEAGRLAEQAHWQQALDERDTRIAAAEAERAQLQQQLDDFDRDRQMLQQQLAAATALTEREQSLTADQQARADEARQCQQALEGDLVKANAQIESLHAKLNEVESKYAHWEAERGSESEALNRQVEALQTQLAESEARLGQQSTERDAERDALQAEIAALQTRLRDADAQEEERRAAQAAEKAALNEQIEALQQRVDASDTEIRSQRDELAARVEALQQAAADSQNGREHLEQACALAAAEKDQLAADLAELQRALDEAQRVGREQSEALERRQQDLSDAQRQLEARTTQAAALEAELQALGQQDETRHNEWRQQLDEANARMASLQADLDAAQQRKQEAERRSAEAEAKLADQVKEHRSELDSARNALTRAQTETENVKREHSRVTNALRKAEENLEKERQDREAELYRLRRELKETAGESTSGLAAELETLQGRLKETVRAREDLEVELGKRSAQLEDVQVEADRLVLQLQQARDSARQAEQQLLDSNQSANEEMAARLEAEEQARQALRGELNAAVAERNRAQEQLTVQHQELDELRQAVATARQQAAVQLETEQAALAQVRDERDQALSRQRELEQQRDEALAQQKETEKTLDQVRAEAEITRGLVDAQAAGGADTALREQLDLAKKNVDVAVRLRKQIEEKNTRLEAELETLREQLQARGASEQAAGRIPSLDADDPQAATVVNPDYASPEASHEEPPKASTGPAPATRLYADENATADTRRGRGGLLTGLLLGACVAAAATWWFMSAAPKGGGPAVSEQGVDGQPLDGEAAANADRQTELKTAAADDAQPAAAAPNRAPGAHKPETPERSSTYQPAFIKGGMPIDTLAQTGDADGVADEAPSDPPQISLKAEPPPAPKPAVTQPLRVFSEPLADGGRSPAMVEFQADSFEMGSGAASANFDERPRHGVQLRRFSIGAREVTFLDYDRFARATGRGLPSDKGWGRGDRPVINVSWRDAVAYAEWLSAQTGSRYRLPTEAEWEFAARAGTDSRFWWGNAVGSGHANCFDCDTRWSGRLTAPAGSFPASAFRVHDMAGNVMEWVQDCYQPDYSAAPADGRAVTQGDCNRRVVRGGAYDSPSASLRSSSRDARDTGTRLDNLGFRVVRE